MIFRRRLVLLAWLFLVPRAPAALPEICRAAFRAVYEKALVEGNSWLGTGIAETESLLLSPLFRDRYLLLLRLSQWVRDPENADVASWVALDLASPGFSSADPAEMRSRRAFLLQSALSRAARELPPEYRAILCEVLVQYPHVRAYEPLTLENTNPRIAAAMARISDAEWTEVYKHWKTSVIVKPRNSPLPWGSSADLKKIFRTQRGSEYVKRIRAELARFLGIKAGEFLSAHRTEMHQTYIASGSYAPVLAKFEDWAEREKVPFSFSVILKVHLYELFGDPPRPQYRPSEIRKAWQDELARQARQLVAEYRASLPAVPAGPKPASASPGIAYLPRAVPAQSNFTGISRRRRARATAREQAERERPVVPEESPDVTEPRVWTEEEKRALYRRMAPDEGYAHRFMKEMEKAKAKWPAEYPQFEANIVQMLAAIEEGVPAGELLERSANHGVWKFRPLGRSCTSRLFVGEIDGEFVLLRLVHDIKSGENNENRICDDLEGKLRQIRTKWESEEP